MGQPYRRIKVGGKKIGIMVLKGSESYTLHADEISLEESGIVVIRDAYLVGREGIRDIMISPPYLIEILK